MRILFVAQHYAPEEVSGAVLATELATDLARRGHEVTFVTCAPSYPHGQVFTGYRNWPYQVEVLDDVRVMRVWSYISPHRTFWPRVCNYGTFSASAFYGGLLAGKPDIIFSYSPPLSLGVSAWLLSRLWRVPWVLRVEDLYPEAAVAAGVLRSRAAISLFSALERFLYREASHISLISDGFRENLLGKGVLSGKMSVHPVWADPDLVRPQAKENSFRRQHALAERFVIMYAGTLGLASALEDVLQAACHLKEDPQVRFLVVGEGVRKETLMSFAQQHDLGNVTFLPFQPRSVFSEMMAAADVSLVTLNPALSSYCLPNKLFSIMASGRPVLAVTPAGSEVARLVEAGQCGLNVPPGDARLLVGAIRNLKDHPEHLEWLGRNGRALLESRFSRRRCVDLYEETLELVRT